MALHSTLRPPPRRWRPAWLRGALAAVLCVAALALAAGPPALAYPCVEPSSSAATRTLSSVAERDCRPPGQPAPKRETDLVSLAFFCAALAFVLLVPLRYSGRRSDDPPSSLHM